MKDWIRSLTLSAVIVALGIGLVCWINHDEQPTDKGAGNHKSAPMAAGIGTIGELPTDKGAGNH